MTLQLILPEYKKYTVTVDKSNLVRLFPDSVIGSAIILDPTVDHIEITNHHVNPNVLNAVRDLARDGRISRLDSDTDHLIPASHYLNMDALSLMTDLGLRKFVKIHPDINLLDLDMLQDPQVYAKILEYGTAHDDLILVDYLFRTAGLNVCPEVVRKEFEYVIRSGSIEMYNLFKTSHRIPMTDVKLGNLAKKKYTSLTLDEIHNNSNVYDAINTLLLQSDYKTTPEELMSVMGLFDPGTCKVLLNKYGSILTLTHVGDMIRAAIVDMNYNLIQYIVDHYTVPDDVGRELLLRGVHQSWPLDLTMSILKSIPVPSDMLEGLLAGAKKSYNKAVMVYLQERYCN